MRVFHSCTHAIFLSFVFQFWGGSVAAIVLFWWYIAGRCDFGFGSAEVQEIEHAGLWWDPLAYSV